MKIKKILSLVLVAMLLLSNLAFAAEINQTENTVPRNVELAKQLLKQQIFNNIKKFNPEVDKKLVKEDYSGPFEDRMEIYNNKDFVRVIVELKGDSIAEKAINNNRTIANLDDAEKETIREELDVIHRETKEAIAESNVNIKYRHTYKTIINGFSAEVSKKDISKLEKMPNVEKVTIANVYYPDMGSAVDLTNATEVWENENLGYKGEGMVVAIIDTGIDWRHKDLVITDESTVKWTKEAVEAKLDEGVEGKYFTPKVPVGWNWADGNDEVIDFGPGASMHGQHVGGIVAANGTIKGVAPEAQLLAEKVFSNKQEYGAFTDDIVAAINHAVEFEADVINMSLGSVAGFILPDDPEQKAIANAVDNGVICAVSAGNSAYNFYPYEPLETTPDIGVVGSPGIFTDTIQVAAASNKLFLYELNVIADGAPEIVGYGKDSWSELEGKDLELIAIGGSKLGVPEDYAGIDVTGKIVLVKRGEYSFYDKTMWAAEQGAAGIIVYNHDPDAKFYKNQGGWAIPFMKIQVEEGLALEELLKDGPITIKVEQKLKYLDPATGQPADFSSWGPSPDLEFKPEIMAPGANIYSLANDDGYQYMSGTSMSAPHVAGGMALIAQALKERVENDELTVENDRSFSELAKILAMNGAEPVANEYGGYYQARLQGSGMMKIDRAITTPVYITDERGKAGVALKEIGNKETFTLTLTNMSNKDVSYSVNGALLADYPWGDGFSSLISLPFEVMESWDMNYAGAITPDKDIVTVPANGEAEVTFTVNIDKAPRNIFVEGFVFFTPEDESLPQLSVPYVGFYGDWNEPDIIDPPATDPDSYFGMTGILSEDFTEELWFTNAISPNNSTSEGEFDYAMPIISLLRNTKDFIVNIKDADGNVIRTVGYEEYMRKFHDLDLGYPYYQFSDEWAWDGKAYNKNTGKFEYVPDGQYYVELKSRIHYENTRWQTLELPIYVDNTEPVVNITNVSDVSEDGTVTIEWDVVEEGSGLGSIMISISEVDPVTESYIYDIDPDTEDIIYHDEFIFIDDLEQTSAEIQLPFKGNEITVIAMDNALNVEWDKTDILINESMLDVPEVPNVVIEYPANAEVYDTRDFTVKGYIESDLPYTGVLKINGEEVTVLPDNTFTVDVSYDNDGWQDLSVEAYYPDKYDPEDPSTYGYRTAWANKIFIDTTTPYVEIDFSSLTGLEIDGNKYLTVSGTVYDDTSIGYEFVANNDTLRNVWFDDLTKVEEDFDYIGLFDVTEKMVFEATDFAGNYDTTVLQAVYDDVYGYSIEGKTIEFTVLDNYSAPVIDSISPATETIVNATDVDIEVEASSEFGIDAVYVNDREAELENGKYVLNIPLNEGINKVEVKAVDKIGMVTKETIDIYGDTCAPEILITMPYFDTVEDTIDITGEVSDVSEIKSVTINGEAVELTDNEFSKTVNLEVGDNTFIIEAIDAFDQVSTEEIVITRAEGDIQIQSYINPVNEGEFIRYDNPAVFEAFADRPVTWTVTVKDINGVVVDTIDGGFGYELYSEWSPAEDAPTGIYTVEFKAVDGADVETTQSEEMVVYNLPVEVTNITTMDINGVETSEFEYGNLVYVKAHIRKIVADTNGIVIIQAFDGNGRPYALKVDNVDLENGFFETTLGFDTYRTSRGTHTVKVYVWNGWDKIEPLSTVETIQFTIE